MLTVSLTAWFLCSNNQAETQIRTQQDQDVGTGEQVVSSGADACPELMVRVCS